MVFCITSSTCHSTSHPELLRTSPTLPPTTWIWLTSRSTKWSHTFQHVTRQPLTAVKPWKPKFWRRKKASGCQRVQVANSFEDISNPSAYTVLWEVFSFAIFLKFRYPVRSWVFKEGFSSDSKSTSVWKHLYAGTNGATKDVIKWQQLLVKLFNLNLLWVLLTISPAQKSQGQKVICVCSGFWRLASLPVWCWGRIFKFPSLTVPFHWGTFGLAQQSVLEWC